MPNCPGRPWSRALAVLAALGVFGSQPASPAEPPSPSSPVSLDWQVSSVTTDSVTHRPVVHARLTLTNRGPTALTAGWTLYFTEIADAVAGDPGVTVERVVGSLFAVRPKAGAGTLAPGQALTLAIDHPGGILRDDKGPTGPYLVPGGSDSALAIRSFTRTGPRPDTPGVPQTLFDDPAAVYRANESWQAASAGRLSPVLPEPRDWQVSEGQGFRAGLAMPTAARGLAGELAFARRLATGHRGGRQLPFTLAIDKLPGDSSDEAYRLTIDSRRGVSVTGASAAGVYYGLQSLEQILFAARQADGSLLLHDTRIADAPRFVWRGLLLDLARNFQSPDRVIRTMDLMARFKLNRLHLHLSDDEGWRLAIPGLPELTAVGGRRGHSAQWHDRLPPAHGSGPDVADPHGSGYFTGDQYVVLLRAARARHIEVIPEFDLPGHARAAIRAMAARASRFHPDHGDSIRLDDPADQSRYQSAQGFTDNVINPAMPGADAFVATVARELGRLHRIAGMPLKTLHIGGDEVPGGAWEGSPAVRAAMAKEGAGGPVKTAMWNRFFDRTLTALQAEGMAPMGWEELALEPGSADGAISRRFADRNATIEIWNDFPGSEGLGNRLANAGYKVVLAPAHALYFDMAQSADPAEPGHDWARVLPLDAVWAFDPAEPAAGAPPLDEAGRRNLLGIEATLFSETVREPWRIDHMLMPRLLAAAERGWSPQPDWVPDRDAARAEAGRRAGWSAFVRRLGLQTLPYVDAVLPGLAYRMPRPGVLAERGRVSANYAWPGVTLRYSLSAQPPTRTSRIMTGPVPTVGLVTIAAFTASGRAGPPVTVEIEP